MSGRIRGTSIEPAVAFGFRPKGSSLFYLDTGPLETTQSMVGVFREVVMFVTGFSG
jgi:hypothetical protein